MSNFILSSSVAFLDGSIPLHFDCIVSKCFGCLELSYSFTNSYARVILQTLCSLLFVLTIN